MIGFPFGKLSDHRHVAQPSAVLPWRSLDARSVWLACRREIEAVIAQANAQSAEHGRGCADDPDLPEKSEAR
jgi:hypothetical protein